MTEAHWYWIESGQQQGPVSASTLAELATAGRIAAETPVWRAGMTDWLPADRQPWFPARPHTSPPPPPPASTSATSTRDTGRAPCPACRTEASTQATICPACRATFTISHAAVARDVWQTGRWGILAGGILAGLLSIEALGIIGGFLFGMFFAGVIGILAMWFIIDRRASQGTDLGTYYAEQGDWSVNGPGNGSNLVFFWWSD